MWTRSALIVSLLVTTSCMGQDTDSDAVAVEPDGESDSDSTSSDTRQDEDSSMKGAGQLPNPRWVLYDADGNAVNAIVDKARLSPSPADLSAGTFFDPAKSNEIGGSVRIQALQEDPLPGATYLDLERGQVHGMPLEHREYYLDENCQGQRYIRPQPLRLYGGQPSKPLMWPEGEIKRVKSNEVYDISRPDGQCEIRGGDSTMGLVPLRRAPDSLRNAFPNPPYTVKPEY